MNLLVSILEPSANLHFEPIYKSLKNCKIFGIFDERFGKPILPSSAFSIMGFVDAISKIWLAKKTIKQMVEISSKVDKVLLIDSPAFNLPLAKAIKEANPKVTIVYYILPQVWAWRANRVKKVESYCDVLASILPFESKFYNRSLYVGNPLLDEISDFKNGYTRSGVVSFLPGSRKSEIKRLFPIYKEVAKRVDKKKILVIPKHFSQDDIDKIYGDVSGFEVSRDARESFLRSEFAFVCSGTATLEGSLIGTPLVLAYKAKRVDTFIAKRFVKIKYVGLANIILDFAKMEPLHAELLQEKVTVENLLKEYEQMDCERFYKRSKELHRILKHGSSKDMIRILNE